MDEAERCHPLGLLQNGRMLAEGSAEELRRDTKSRTLEEAFLVFASRQHDAGHNGSGGPL